MTSGLLADWLLFALQTVANDCATISESCSGSGLSRSDGLVHSSAERFFVLVSVFVFVCFLLISTSGSHKREFYL